MMKIKATGYMQAVEFVYNRWYGDEDFAIISIQEGSYPVISFNVVRHCKAALHLCFNDATESDESSSAFTEEHARKILNFVLTLDDSVTTILVHCNTGASRSVAVAQVLNEYINGLPKECKGSEHVYRVLDKVFSEGYHKLPKQFDRYSSDFESFWYES